MRGEIGEGARENDLNPDAYLMLHAECCTTAPLSCRPITFCKFKWQTDKFEFEWGNGLADCLQRATCAKVDIVNNLLLEL